MYFSIPIVLGIIATVAGLGPLGPILIAAGVVGFAVHFALAARAGRPSREPEDVPGGFKKTGFAHEGQGHMTPETLQRESSTPASSS